MVTHFIPKLLFKEVESCHSYKASDPTLEANNAGACPSGCKYRAVGRDWEGVEEGGDRRPYHWASCWIIPPSMPSSLPPHKWPGSSDNRSLSPLRATPVFSGHTQSHTADSEKNTNNLILDFSSNLEQLGFFSYF